MSSLFITQKKWKSILALIIFILVVAVNFIVISFGMKITPIVDMLHKAQEIATDVSTKDFKIEDITVNTTRVMENRQTSLGVYATNSSAAGLRFESLTPDVFEMARGNTLSTVLGKLFDDNEEHKGILRVTSIYDKSFSKDVEITFYKSYNKHFEAVLTRHNGMEGEKYVVYKDSPFYFHYDNGKSKVPVQYVFNEEYLTNSEDQFIPKKTGETSVTVQYNNTYEKTFNVVIKDAWAQVGYDDIIISNYPIETDANPLDLKIGYGYSAYILKDNQRQYYPISITSPDSDILFNSGYFYAATPGEYTINVEYENNIITKNVKFTGDIIVPTIKSKFIQKTEDGYTVSAYKNGSRSINVNFTETTADTRLTFEFDSNDFDITYKRDTYDRNTLTVKPKYAGTKTFTVVVGKGTEQESKIVFTVNAASDGIQSLVSRVKKIFQKGASHILLFFGTGIAMVLLLIFCLRKWPLWGKVLFALPFGIILGGIEELIQMTEPGRYPSAIDVFGYDFVSYVVGMLLCWAIIAIVNICVFKYKKKKGIYAPYVREIPKNE